MFNARLLIAAGGLLLFSSMALAQAPTPTPTATPALNACQQIQGCVDTGGAALVTGCISANPDCSDIGETRADRFAVTASELADRALATTRTAGKVCTAQTKKSQCNACYKLAKVPLKSRYDAKIFHGLLANAASIIEARRQTFCGALKK